MLVVAFFFSPCSLLSSRGLSLSFRDCAAKKTQRSVLTVELASMQCKNYVHNYLYISFFLFPPATSVVSRHPPFCCFPQFSFFSFLRFRVCFRRGWCGGLLPPFFYIFILQRWDDDKGRGER
ncbi:hypothetical protein, unlikely [Trypanosoma brucei gambiense DAL972]|uniref:T. brucei spp.-specific protein n=1 Tax=Trypanosoma brucei gambiense (strain MHOM/CI/86/DAL972) TaxID=679716 RepID=D0A4U3_TRYB9|nr:hypothetical protein, unlikely [Trypanosoma brucei gambiense DAL972]CBH16287.1 hypothetical protein, unlikely [Trypanosoma brucei gambiense DAL972]|eukprot:XP_011778551.1 hypothetical protein, unlikely [Trypanosoma brucei gambiense DAL972]